MNRISDFRIFYCLEPGLGLKILQELINNKQAIKLEIIFGFANLLIVLFKIILEFYEQLQQNNIYTYPYYFDPCKLKKSHLF